MHRSAVLVMPGSNPENIEYFGVIRIPSSFILNFSNPKKLQKMVLRIEKKIDEIEELTVDTFIKISEAFN